MSTARHLVVAARRRRHRGTPQPLFADAVNGVLPVSDTIRDRLTALHADGEIPLFGDPWINSFFHDGMVSINLLREPTDASDPESFSRTEVSLREALHQDSSRCCGVSFPNSGTAGWRSRASRRGFAKPLYIVGEYHLVRDDIIQAKLFPDTVAKGAVRH